MSVMCGLAFVVFAFRLRIAPFRAFLKPFPNFPDLLDVTKGIFSTLREEFRASWCSGLVQMNQGGEVWPQADHGHSFPTGKVK